MELNNEDQVSVVIDIGLLMDDIMEFHMDNLVNKYLDEENYDALEKLFNGE